MSETVIEMAIVLRDEQSSAQLAFRRCMVCVEDIHRAYATALKAKVPALTIGDLHLMALFVSHQAGRWQPTLSMYLIPGTWISWVAREPETAEEVNAFEVTLKRLREGDPFALSAERSHQARCLALGEFTDAVVHAAVGTEILLDGVLGMLLWEDRVAASDAVQALGRPLASRVKSEFHPRLGGKWDPDNNALGKWKSDLMYRRHRAVHRGIRATEDEAARAIAAEEAFTTFVLHRVLEKRTSYPRLALIMVGLPSLRRRGYWNQAFERWLANSGEDPDEWASRYTAWRDKIDQQIQISGGL